MNKLYQAYLRSDKIVFYSFVLSFVSCLFIVNLFAFRYPELPTTIPLFYSLPWGDDQLASLPQFIILPSLILLIFLINLVIVWHLHHSQNLLKRSLSVTTALTSFILAVAAFKIVTIFT